MRSMTSGLLLLVLSGLCACVHANEPGDFAPRGTLLYVRADDFSASLNKLGGDDWRKQIGRASCRERV